MEPIDYGGALRRSWRLLLALAIIGAVVAVLVPVSHPKKVKSATPYIATATVGSAPSGARSPLNGTVTAQQIAFLANTTDTQQDVADVVGLEAPAYALPDYMSAAVIASSGAGGAKGGAIKRGTPTVVQLTGHGATPTAAVALVTAYTNTLAYVVSGAVGSNSSTTGGGYTVIRPAALAAHTGKGKSSLGSSRKVRGLAGLVIGALVGAAIILLRELLDKRLRNAHRAEANFGFPVVVEIPSASASAAAALPGLTPMVDVIRDPGSPGAEAYRMLRMSVMFEGLASLAGPTDPYALGFDPGNGGPSSADQRIGASAPEGAGNRHVVLVVSAGSEPSRPYVAANLAAIYAEASERVVVISTGEVEAGGSGAHPTTVTGAIRAEDIEAHLEPSRLEHVSRLPLSPFISRSGQLVTRAPAILEAARQVSDVIIVEVP
ncbi:MAG: hypothetical protein ACRDYE_14405, partial [Acidimicrobiales bacterium]